MNPLDSRIYLASRSPRRRELLTQIGLRFDLLLFRSGGRSDPEVDESVQPGENPDTYVVRVAKAKAAFGARVIAMRHLPPRPVLAADTTLDFEGEVIGKPTDEADARNILARLSGKTHRVLTAIALVEGDRLVHATSVSEVRFRDLDTEEIRRYVASGEPMDKAGAYGLQGRAAMFVAEVKGSPSGIVGLPLCETSQLLKQFGLPVQS
ncbi:MAG: septum formation inhibitor Maf [Rhodocyclaceae bacterium]|nr:MAG: septum formation inhibitor Maf [Rhodocyclaceae bacterium]